MLEALMVLSIVIVTHEFCHARVMLKYGVEIEEFSIGFPVKYVPRIEFSSPHILEGAKILINPLLVGGYVKPKSAEKINELSFSNQADIFSAGIIGNFISGFLFFLVYFSLTGQCNIVMLVQAVIILSMVPFIFFKWGKAFVDFVIIPLWGVVILAALIGISVYVPDVSVVGGPVETISLLSQEIRDSLTFLMMLGSLSLSVGLLNAIPFGFLDGGRILQLILERFCYYKLADIFMSVTSALFVGFIFYILLVDVFKAIML